jgi:hypothetical protein
MLDILHSQAIGVKRYLIDYRCTGACEYPGNLSRLTEVDDTLAAKADPMPFPTTCLSSHSGDVTACQAPADTPLTSQNETG